MHWEFVGNSYELFGKPLVFIGNPWKISGDFRLGIHSLGEVQIQTEHILTHAISLTKPRFPFHVLTGFFVTLFGHFLAPFFCLVFWTGFYIHFRCFWGPFWLPFSVFFSLQNYIVFLIDFWMAFWRILSPLTLPDGALAYTRCLF